MIPRHKERVFQSQGISESTSFDISSKDSAHIMTILRDTLYSDKILAVLREYSSNAWDAHRDAGKPETPIKITMPTSVNPTLSIRDFGVGLSHEDVFKVYTQYGSSTKRDSDAAVGMLGIGSKSAFAYSDTFTVISRHKGRQRTYIAVLDETNKGTMNLVFEKDCGSESGVEIQIPVKVEDIIEFDQKAKQLFKYFDPPPDINTVIPEIADDKAIKLNNGIILEDNWSTTDWVAVMGCVPYRVNLYQLDGIADFAPRISGILFFDIGEVQISASREELKYSEGTKKSLVEKFNALIDEYIADTLARFESLDLTPWERRLRGIGLRSIGFPILEKYSHFIKSYVAFPETESFFITTGRKTQSGIKIQENTKLIIKDTHRALSGYPVENSQYSKDYILRPRGSGKNKATIKEVQKELNKILDDLDLKGISVFKLSEFPWTKPHKGQAVERNLHKYTIKSFLLKKPDKNKRVFFCHPYSDCWEPVKRTPTDNDVYVVLNRFRASYDFYNKYKNDFELAKTFGAQIPNIYGYKETDKNPIDHSTLKGKEYREWRVEFLKSLIKGDLEKDLQALQWTRTATSYRVSRYFSPDEAVNTLKKELGKDHPITELFVIGLHSQREFESLRLPRRRSVDSLLARLVQLDLIENPALVYIEKLKETYPIFSHSNIDFRELLDNDNDALILFDYIKTIDNGGTR